MVCNNGLHTNFIKREEPEKLLFNRISLEYIYLQIQTRQPTFNAMVEDGVSSKDLLTCTSKMKT